MDEGKVFREDRTPYVIARDEVALYRLLVGARVRGQMQYRASFALQVAGSFLGNALELVALLIVFSRFHDIAGWSVGEVTLLYALSAISFALHEMIMAGFDEVSYAIQQGEFDRVLVRPVTPFVQTLAADFQMRRIGRVLQGVVALGIAVSRGHIHWDAGKIVYFPVVILSGVLLFSALTLLGATLCFWTVERSEAINIFTYGGAFMSDYPISIYAGWLRGLMIFVVPLAFVAYFPALYFLDRTAASGVPPFVPFLTPFVAVAFFALAWRVWEWGVRHYQSAGS